MAVDLGQAARQAQLPGSRATPPEQALRALLALKLLGKERKSHVMNLLFDEALALFAGRNVMPKRSYLSACSSSIGEQGVRRLMEIWFEQVQHLALAHSGCLDLDFHTVPANSQKEPLKKDQDRTNEKLAALGAGEEVVGFLMAVAGETATLEKVTGEVREWLDERHLLGRFKVRLQRDLEPGFALSGPFRLHSGRRHHELQDRIRICGKSEQRGERRS